MVKRSLQASLTGIQETKRAFARKGWTQDNLAAEVNLKTRQPIWRFFSGRPVERHTFIEICLVLELNWREIATNPPAEFLELEEYTQSPVLDIDTLVQQVRSQRFDKIQDQCGILQLLNISYPVAIDDIYIDVNILEEIESLQWLDISELQKFNSEEFDRFGLGEVDQKQIPGIRAVETYPKLRVLGKPGVGKTTFLQHLAIQCNQGAFAANQVPIFITLRNFAQESKVTNEFSLLKYIHQEFLTSGISDPSVIETLLNAGRVLLLLDALSVILGIILDVGLYKSLQQLSDQFPNSHQSQERFELWWQTNYSTWAKQLNTTIINYRNINHQWHFSPEQQQVLQRYYDANQLLLDCLHSNSEVTPAIRQEIKATLLLPIKELEDREWQ
ncbi:MAG: NACHT domain-containing protein [Nostoc sp.]|uniref:NACHT domain-containing protein n=1 Tax=Nostoc sp. TaxID=1180 RepID=UPI002FF41B82